MEPSVDESMPDIPIKIVQLKGNSLVNILLCQHVNPVILELLVHIIPHYCLPRLLFLYTLYQSLLHLSDLDTRKCHF